MPWWQSESKPLLSLCHHTCCCLLCTSPLGDERGYGSSAPLRGKKGTEFEGGMRVPFIAAWAKPEKKSKVQKNLPIEVGSMQTQLGTIMDIYPTVLSVAGCEVPQNYVKMCIRDR